MMTAEEIEAKRQLRRSHVRIVITYVAAGFLFLGGYGMVVYLLVCGKIDEAKSLFLSILPVSAAVISFWFGGRNPSDSSPQQFSGS